jgi:hypothetical protein
MNNKDSENPLAIFAAVPHLVVMDDVSRRPATGV